MQLKDPYLIHFQTLFFFPRSDEGLSTFCLQPPSWRAERTPRLLSRTLCFSSHFVKWSRQKSLTDLLLEYIGLVNVAYYGTFLEKKKR